MRGNISLLGMQENRIVATIDTGKVPNYALITKDGKRAYVSNTGSNNIAEVDLNKRKVLRLLESGPTPEHMAFSDDQKNIFVTNPGAGKVSMVDINSGKVKRSFSVGKSVHGLDISDDHKSLFVSSKNENRLVSIDIQSGLQKSLELSPSPYHLNTITGTGKLYVSSRKKPLIWVVDQATLKLIKTMRLPAGEGHQMAVVSE